MRTLKNIIKQIPPLKSLVRERDRLLVENRRLAAECNRLLAATQDFFLAEAKGVIHVGANTGQEAVRYAVRDLHVLWVEPIDDAFLKLQENLKDYPKQRALQCLLTDVDDEEYVFQISNNAGLSSSIFNLAKHRDIWPDVHYVESVKLRSITFSSLLRKERIDLMLYDSLIIDTQGAELLVLKGPEILSRISASLRPRLLILKSMKDAAP